MTTRKNTSIQNAKETSFEDDDYYAVERKRIAEEAQKAHRIHEEDIQSHLTAMIPYYDDAEWGDRRRLLLLNNLLIHRFEEVGMVYWGIFRHTPSEIRDYRDIFGADLSETDMNRIISFLSQKKEESENMVEMGFDEDGEEDDIAVEKEKDEDPADDSREEDE